MRARTPRNIFQPRPTTTVHHQFSCIVIGDGSLTVQCCDLLLKREHHLLGVVSANPELADWATRHDIPLHRSEKDCLAALGDRPFDYLFSIVNMRILPQELVSRPSRGAINFHDGPLPKYAGVHATSWALINREKTHGVTWHLIGDLVDGGGILEQQVIEVPEEGTAFALNTQCFEAGIRTFSALVPKLEEGTANPVAQDLSQRSYFGMWERPDDACLLSWRKPAEEIAAFVRALEFGPVPNPLGMPKIRIGDELYLCPKARAVHTETGAPPGTILAVGEESFQVATGRGGIEIPELFTMDGRPVAVAAVIERHGLDTTSRLPELSPERSAQISERNSLCRKEAFWVRKLRHLSPASIPYFESSRPGASTPGPQFDGEWTGEGPESEPHSGTGAFEFLSVAFGAFLARLGDEWEFDLGVLPALPDREDLPGRLFSPLVPFRVAVDPNRGFAEQYEDLRSGLRTTLKHRTFARDVVKRYPELHDLAGDGIRDALSVQVERVETLGEEAAGGPGFALRLVVETGGNRWRLTGNPEVISEDNCRTMADQFATWLKGIASDQTARIADLPLLSETELHKILEQWNETAVEIPAGLTIHTSFEKQVAATPDSIAATCQREEVTYRELNERANRLARHLRKLGAGPDTLVGIYLERSVDMIVGLMGILKSGAAYVPLDPGFPEERIDYMLKDSKSPVLLTQSRLRPALPQGLEAQVTCIDADWPEIEKESAENFESGAEPHHMAYVIYTSGSTGKPKGVMVEHRNVVNFFAGMDRTIEYGRDPVWLAVTSLSFDISVLEIFWTLARGFKVVTFIRDDFDPGPADPLTRAMASRPIDFSIFYFSADQGEDPENKYRLLRESVKFADQNEFTAVWTPERHFHNFGGLYPNPAVTGAAMAVMTEKVQIRSGSVVAPLHSPIRLAEDWSVVDNLSGGRVGVSFASGWMPEDFVIKPETFADRKEVMFESIETVRKLWRGEAVPFPHPLPGHDDVMVQTMPRPVQKELPVWVTTAGNPETFRMAAETGSNVLTHLLGQSIEEVSKNIALYRKVWKETGQPGKGQVTLMLHTFVSDDLEKVKETVRGPLTEYLRTSAGLIRKYSWSFPTFKKQGLSADEVDFGDLSPEELDAVLDHAFERYYETSGLFGTPETCAGMIAKLKANDIDEVACLVDFGVGADLVLENLPHLNTLRAATSQPAADEPDARDGQSIPALIRDHQVTHFQCTPSMAAMLLVDDAAAASFGRLEKWMIGGEAFPESLAEKIRKITPADVINMYGPTETTIWSTTYKLNGGRRMSIGRPIANTQIYIVDRNMRPVPAGVTGELIIGGDGVVRGYHNQPELTAERFIKNPFSDDPAARLYRTGDLARAKPDGNIEFIGRIDHQVKIRGYRIELGEIEKRLSEHPAVSECVVIAREDNPGDKRLVAYVIPAGGEPPEPARLREHVGSKLPPYMVPSNLVFMESFPQTPNKKIDRKALPRPGQDVSPSSAGYEPPATEIEETLAELWKDALGIERAGRTDNFFDLGGHSLSAVQIAFNIGKTFEITFPLRTFMEEPVLSALAQRVEDLLLENADSDELEDLLAQIENSA